nr:glycoside hydrolase family 3 N-terminal domain-containing protein [uncultured Schaedlerella sp.]
MDDFKNTEKAPEVRAKDLLGRMTWEEKLAQLQCVMVMDTEGMSELADKKYGIGEIMVQSAAEDPVKTAEVNRKIIHHVVENSRFGIPPILHAEALSGAVLPGAMVFPSAIGLGATFHPAAVEAMTDTISQQMRAAGYRQALSPVMDLGRDPRWGRIGETYGEDPALCAMMSVAFTKGLQGKDSEKEVAATGKHFLGYSYGDGGLNMSSNPITERDIREEYAKPFQAAISEAGLMSVMNSYGSLDHELVIGSEKFLTSLLRDEMKFDGAVVSDYHSIDKLVSHRITEDMTEAGVKALKAGLDVECPMPVGYTEELLKWVESGKLDGAYIDRAVLRVLELKFKLGLFENPYPLDPEMVRNAFYSQEHERRSLQAARESIVMLKNEGILPLDKQKKKVAVIGPHADSIRLLFGCYTLPAAVDMGLSGALSEMAGMEEAAKKADTVERADTYEGSNVLREPEIVGQALAGMYGQTTPTILSCIKEKLADSEVTYEKGCEYAGYDRSGFAPAIQAAKEAEVAIVTAGGKYGWGGSCTVGEGIDSAGIGLTGVQEELILELCRTGTPVVLIHMDARPLSSEAVKDSCSAILEFWYPGTTGGQAVADVIFGDYNPAGRLPVTAARNAGQIPVYAGQKTGNAYPAVRSKMSLCKYVEDCVEPLYPFGHGLSYSSFVYSDLQITDGAPCDGEIEVSLNITNVSDRDGEEVVQIYIEDVLAEMLRPNREFAGCDRIFLKAGETKTVEFRMKADQFAYLDQQMEWFVEAGEMKVYAGASSDDIRLTGKFRILDSGRIEGNRRGFYASVCETGFMD